MPIPKEFTQGDVDSVEQEDQQSLPIESNQQKESLDKQIERLEVVPSHEHVDALAACAHVHTAAALLSLVVPRGPLPG